MGGLVADNKSQKPPGDSGSAQVGDLTLAIPKLRQGSFFPNWLEPRRRVDKALYAVVMEAYTGGISTRLPGRRPACRRH